MRILVTGGTGFIGSHLARALVQSGHDVRCLVRRTSNIGKLDGLGLQLVYGDIVDVGSLAPATQQVDVVFHLAAIRGEGSASLKRYREVNVQGTSNLLEASRLSGVKHFVYASSIGVIGWLDSLPGSELSQCNPKGKYHVTKYEGEKLSQEFCSTKGLPVTIVRPVMTYGEHGDGFLPNLARLVKKRRFRLIGNGDNCLHLVDVQNLVQGFVLTLRIAQPAGEVYIIADENPVTLRRLVTIMADFFSVEIPNGSIPIWFAAFSGFMLELAYKASFRSGEPPITRSKVELLTKHRFYDISKAKRELGYRPVVDTEDGVSEALSVI